MKCPECQLPMIHVPRDIEIICQGKQALLPDVVGDFCLQCGKSIFTGAEDAALFAEAQRLADTPEQNQPRIH